MQSNIKKKEVLRENAKELPKDRMEALLNEMSKTHADGVGALLKEREGHFEDIKLKQETSDEEDENTCHEKLDEVPDMIKLRSEIVGNLSSFIEKDKRDSSGTKQGWDVKYHQERAQIYCASSSTNCCIVCFCSTTKSAISYVSKYCFFYHRWIVRCLR